MAVEEKRGCGYRKVGGLYLVGGGIGIPCDRLPFELTVCSCCGQGIKQALGWTWVDVAKFFSGPHQVIKFQQHFIYPGAVVDTNRHVHPCDCGMYPPAFPCPLCHAPHTMGRAGLLWIGEKFYKNPSDFVKEGVELGFSRRIKAIPHGFKVGETWVLLAHSKAVLKPLTPTEDKTIAAAPGIFYVWLPKRVERLYKESQKNSEEVQADEKRGIIPVFVPDSDTDHQGNVHDDFEREKKKAKKS